MSRPLVILLAILIVVIGGIVFLSTRAQERPTTHVEKVVPLANLQ